MVGRFLCAAFVVMSLAALPVRTGYASVVGSARLTPLASRVSAAGTGTMVLRGSLSSTVSITLHGALSVGHATGLSWNLVLFPTMRLSGYRQRVLSQTFHFNVPPDSFEDLTQHGIEFRRFHWNAPPANTVIRVAQHLTLRVKSHLNRFADHTPYPLQSVSAEAQPYLQVTPSLALTGAQRSYVRWLVRKKHTERGAVRKIDNWIASHVRYDDSLVGGPYSASWVMTNHRATCQGYASLMAGMLRVLGIPAQVVYGIVSDQPVTMWTKNSSHTITWGGTGTHAWINIYFPNTGWVSFDPQMEKFFVDTRHYAMLTEVDASNPVIGQIMAYPVGNLSITGRPLKNGTFEILPGDGWGRLSVSLHDSSAVHIASVVHDVHTITLFSR